MDLNEKQELIASLANKAKTAACKVSTKVEAEKGDYKIIITSQGIEQYYKGNPVSIVKVADLNDQEIELINSDASDAAKELLNQFAGSFNAEKTASSSSTIKTAANSAVDDSSLNMITQKQLEEHKPKFHPRTNDYPNHTTDKQLVNDGQRPGTYENTTEAQLKEERSTFYGKPRTAGDWKEEDRNVVTEAQLDKGAKEYSDLGQSDRGEIGSQYDGGVEKQWKQIGEKQLMELLRHHKWEEPLTTTEGKDQLGKQDGELSRLSDVNTAEKIIKEAFDALGKTIIAGGVLPETLAGVVRQLVSHNSKLPVLANVIKSYAGSDTNAIEKKISNARYFGKVANANQNCSDDLIADMFVRQLSKSTSEPLHIAQALSAMSQQTDFVERITQAADESLSTDNTKTAENEDIFKQILAGDVKPIIEGSDDDGKYEYTGKVTEVQADVKDEDGFAKAAAEYVKKQITAHTGKELNLTPDKIKVNTAKGIFSLTMNNTDTLEARASRRRELAAVKTAQMGGMGGAPPPGGDPMGNPAPPTGPGGAPGAPGTPPAAESLTQDPLGMEGEEESTGEPKPPGTSCPLCGQEDVDIDNGEFRCNNCGAEGNVYIRIDIKKAPGIIAENDDNKEEEGFGLGTEPGLGEGEPTDVQPSGEGEGTTMPNMPVASASRITHHTLEKLASQGITLGSVCPNCGKNNTNVIKSKLGGSEGVCWDCGQDYSFKLKAQKGKKNSVFAEVKWLPKQAMTDCAGCNRLSQAFRDSLKEYGMSWQNFNKQTMFEQGETVLKMATAGVLDLSQAMNAPLPIEKFAARPGYGQFDQFPIATCIEKLARRFGENATAMSGPCRGKQLADCVCSQLKSLNTYSDGLAAKVASTLASKDPMENNPVRTCVRMFEDQGWEFKQACVACDGLRAAHASTEDLLIEAIAQLSPGGLKPMPMSPRPTKPMQMSPKPMPMSPNPLSGAKPMEAPEMGGGPISAEPKQMAQPKPMLGGMIGGAAGGAAGAAIGGGPAGAAIGGALGGGAGSEMDEKSLEGGDEFGHSGADFGGNGDLSVEIEGDLGSDMAGGLGNELGGDLEGEMGGGNVVTLLQDIAQDLMQLTQVLQGNVGDDMIDTGFEDEGSFGNDDNGDNSLDMGDVTEDIVEDDHNDDEESHDEHHEDSDSGIPGVVDDDDDNLVKDSGPDEKPCGNNCGGNPNKKPTQQQPEHNPETPEEGGGNHNANSTQQTKTASVAQKNDELTDMLYGMKTGTIRKASTSLDNLFEGLMRQAAKAQEVKKVERKDASESKVKTKPAQDSESIGKFSGDSTIGNEESFTTNVKKGFDAPRGKALIGDEDSDLTINETGDMPSVPRADANLKGEENFKSDKNNNVDGNQGREASSKKTVKTAKVKIAGCGKQGCQCKQEGCNCKDCASGNCSKSCAASNSTGKKTVVGYNMVQPGHKLYTKLIQKLASGNTSVKLSDGKTYKLTLDQKKNVILAQKIKESQTVSPKSVTSLEDDPDINQSSGPGKGKTHADQTHSLAVDEKKPSEGLNEPDVPKAPNGGRLSREHTVEKANGGPTIPAGGGMNPDYDTNEKNTPEKLDETLGKQNDLGAVAETKDLAMKVAGQLLKANRITIDEMPQVVNELSRKTTAEILEAYEKTFKTASTQKGMQKQSNKDEVENVGAIVNQASANNEQQIDLSNQIKSLFKLDKQNRDYEKYVATNSPQLWR